MKYLNHFLLLVMIVAACEMASAQKQNLRTLQVGDSAICEAVAKKRVNKTMLRLERRATYLIRAGGQWQDAGFKPTDANGFAGFTKAMKFGNGLKPMPGENYLKLLARVGNYKKAIGVEGKFTPRHSGRLILTPNDARFFFGNNSGSLKVTVKRIQ